MDDVLSELFMSRDEAEALLLEASLSGFRYRDLEVLPKELRAAGMGDIFGPPGMDDCRCCCCTGECRQQDDVWSEEDEARWQADRARLGEDDYEAEAYPETLFLAREAEERQRSFGREVETGAFLAGADLELEEELRLAFGEVYFS